MRRITISGSFRLTRRWNLSIFPTLVLALALLLTCTLDFSVAGDERNEGVQLRNHSNFNFSNLYNGSANGLDLETFVAHYNLDDPENGNITDKEIIVEVTVDASGEFLPSLVDKPLLVAIAYQDTISVMRLPDETNLMRNITNTTQLKARRTVCLKTVNSTSTFGYLRISVRTQNPENVPFTLKTSLKDRKEIKLNEVFVVDDLAWNSPRFFPFRFPSPKVQVDHVLVQVNQVKVNSSDAVCMTFSIQAPECPVRDDEDNVGYRGGWQTEDSNRQLNRVLFPIQTMSIIGAMTINQHEFPNGFHIVLVVHRDDEFCSSRRKPPHPHQHQQIQSGNSSVWSERETKVNITITNKSYEYSVKFQGIHMSYPLAIFVLISVIALLIIQYPTYYALKGAFPIHQKFLGNPDKQGIFIPDFKEYKDKHLKGRRGSYFTAVLVAAVFYTIPVYQLIIHNVATLHEMGEFDLCYYNYLCANSLGAVFDFNHVWSNIGYIMLGLTYIIIVRKKKFYEWKMDVERLRTLCDDKSKDNPDNKDDNTKAKDANHEDDPVTISTKEGELREPLLLTVKDNEENPAGEDMGTTSKKVETQSQNRLAPVPISNSNRIPVLKGFSQESTFYSFIHSKGNEEIEERWESIRQHGLPPHTQGLHQALGFALVMEGFLSAAYHLCPNQSNFQFDTNFMYTICILGLVKVYQFRHPVYPDSSNVLRLLGAFCIVCVIGFSADYTQICIFCRIFKIVFTITHILCTAYCCVYNYGLGFINDKSGQVQDVIQTRWYAKICKSLPVFLFGGDWEQIGSVFKDFFTWKMGGRSLTFICTILLNVGLIVYYFDKAPDFADQFLYILMSNFILSTALYIGHKLWLEGSYIVNVKDEDEETKKTFYRNYMFLILQPAVYLVLCLIFGGVALYCFTSTVTDWETTPASSRNVNKACYESIILTDRYYDSHDYWHGLSAISLFFGYMMLLTLDDNLFGIHHREISVF